MDIIGTIPLKKTNSPFPGSHQLSVDLSKEVRLLIPFPLECYLPEATDCQKEKCPVSFEWWMPPLKLLVRYVSENP